MLRWLSNKVLSFSLVFKREAYRSGYVTLAGYAVPSMDLWINFKLRAALPTSRGCAGDGNKSLHIQFILFSGRRIKLAVEPWELLAMCSKKSLTFLVLLKTIINAEYWQIVRIPCKNDGTPSHSSARCHSLICKLFSCNKCRRCKFMIK